LSLLRKFKKLFSVSRLFKPFLKSLNFPLTAVVEKLLFDLENREDTESSLTWIGLTVEEARLGDEFPMTQQMLT